MTGLHMDWYLAKCVMRCHEEREKGIVEKSGFEERGREKKKAK